MAGSAGRRREAQREEERLGGWERKEGQKGRDPKDPKEEERKGEESPSKVDVGRGGTIQQGRRSSWLVATTSLSIMWVRSV